MKYCKVIFITLLAVAGSMANETDTLFQRLKNGYAFTESMESVKELMQEQRKDGTWPDVKYKKGSVPINHLKKTRYLSQGFNRYCPEASRKDFCDNLKGSVVNSLQYWFSNNKDYVSDNWWSNEIGIQQEFAPILFMMWNELPDSLKKQAISQFPEAPSGNGTNRTWLAELVAIRGIFEKRDSLIELGVNEIVSTIQETGREGHQVDHSYYMHGNLLYSGGYGKVTLSIASHWASVCRGTKFAFNGESMKALSALALDGTRWMMWKGMVDPMTMGREISRKGENKIASGFLPIIENLSAADTLHKKEYDAWKREISGANSLNGCRYFWRSEFMVCRSNGYYISLKMSSRRTVGSEFVNRENSQGFWLGMGVLSLYRHGYDFDNIYPLWDWTKIPGVTSYGVSAQKDKQLTNKSEFVGGLGDENIGVASMESKRPGLEGRKSWIFLDNKVVALGADIKSNLDNEVLTTLDQRYFRTAVLGDKKLTKVTDSVYSFNAVWHDSIGYKSLDGKPIYVKTQNRKGSWKNIGTQKGDESDSLITIVRVHGVTPKDESYAYAIEMNVGSKQFPKWINKKDIEVLANDSKAQVIRYTPKSYVAGTLYEPQTIELKSHRISFSAPCTFLMRQSGSEMHFVLADPTKNLQNMKITVEKITKSKPSLAYSVIVNFPQNLEAGKSVNAWFEL
ncbi:polysaccharide lyase family 8 super-sandwich domain-containing protein [uncultured Fibrobacter sp.]|uniref:polysaccharide lyase family 8 super-sandwich domain-containing protein n=1 Tax=uncultured Fibrobacter sp. TaxID=261512 RepID=UPI0025F755A8|nr:polysaccharide lyase family 8 super-sandwich domain-containing protein [uncultured Fibrobacter sp.]